MDEDELDSWHIFGQRLLGYLVFLVGILMLSLYLQRNYEIKAFRTMVPANGVVFAVASMGTPRDALLAPDSAFQ